MAPLRRPGSTRGPAFTLLVALAGAAPAHAVHPATRLYGRQDGLPQQRVTAVSQDAQGFLWIGTQRGGLARYDGQAWRVLDTADGLPSNDVRWLSRAPDGTLYAATAGGFGRLHGMRFERLSPPAAGSDRLVRVLDASTPGRVWVGRRAGLSLWTEPGGLAPVPLAGDGAEPDVQGLAPDGAGGEYAGTSRGLAHVSAPAALRVEWVKGLPAGVPSVLARRRDGSLAVGVDGVGLFVGRPGAFGRLGDERSPTKDVLSLFDDGEEGLLVGTSGDGTFRCRTRCSLLVGEDLKPGGLVFDIYRDREGILWFATSTGLGKRVPSAFQSYDSSDGFPATEYLYGMAESKDGSLWVAASGARVVRLGPDGRARAYSQADGLPGVLVTHVLTTRDGRVLATTRGGLFRLDGDRFVRQALPPGVPDDLNMALDTPAGLYVATWNRGLYLVHGGSAQRVPAPVGPVVETVAPLRDGRVACGGAGFGVVVLEGARAVSQTTARDSLPSDWVNWIQEDSAGALWVATDAGAWCRRPDGTRLVLDRGAGLPGSHVYWVVEARDRAHWLGTNHGVVRRLPDGRLERYTTRDGLARDECSPASAFVDSRGRLFVGTSTLSVLGTRPAPPSALPPVYVEARPGAGPVRVPPGGAVDLHFTSPSFVDEQATRFRTRLVGLHDDWRESPPGHFGTTFGGLAPGAYRFEVEAVTSDGRVSTPPARLPLTVEPRWWERRSVRLGVLVLAVLLAAAAVRLRERAHAAAAARLRRVVDERTDALRLANTRLERLAATDELTGVANRRRAMEGLQQAIAVARRQRLPLSVALVDLDGFKAVNDTRGHHAGDECLRWIAQQLEAALRAGDQLGRLGGDEFLAVLVATDLAGARRAAERMSEQLAAHPWRPADGGDDLPITLSLGLTALRDGDGPDALLSRADEALYAAKRAGRARAVSVD
jgi:diguanylate cyclase (GGDEF)-like protein